jgi:hypothetical protein
MCIVKKACQSHGVLQTSEPSVGGLELRDTVKHRVSVSRISTTNTEHVS